MPNESVSVGEADAMFGLNIDGWPGQRRRTEIALLMRIGRKCERRRLHSECAEPGGELTKHDVAENGRMSRWSEMLHHHNRRCILRLPTASTIGNSWVQFDVEGSFLDSAGGRRCAL